VTAIVARENLTRPGEDGWSFYYRVRRDDAEEVTFRVSCPQTATAVATLKDNADALRSMKHYGAVDVVSIAEQVESPARCGRAHVTMLYSLISGDLLWRVDYERPAEALAAAAV
jgi:hypothetical protein